MSIGSDSILNDIASPFLVESMSPIADALIGTAKEFGTSIIIRRKSSTLPAQDCRIALPGRGRVAESNQARQPETTVYVVGDPSFDVQVGDRFTHESVPYEVFFVRPHKQVHTVAEAKVAE